MSTWTRRGRALGALAVAWLALGAATGSDGSSAAVTYRGLLELYAGGQEAEALRRLIDLEWSLVEEGHDLEQVRRIEVGLVEGLPPGNPKALLPVIALHESAFLAYRAEGSMAHAFHSRTTMYLLCEIFAGRVATAEQRRLAGDLFASVGGYLQQSATGSAGRELFQRSLIFDDANAAALLGAATAEEQRGRYPKALRFLERFAQAHPDNPEGRLRLAINLERAARSSRAVSLLEGLLEIEAPRWVLSLTHQALARSHLDAGRTADARRVLQEGVARFPDDPILTIALAYACERQAADSGGPDLFPALQRTALLQRAPPRFRYSRPPVELFEQARSRLRRSGRESRPVLAEALAGGPRR